MVEIWTMLCSVGGLSLIVVGLFLRIEHRLTKVETIVTIIAVKVGICQQNLDENTE